MTGRARGDGGVVGGAEAVPFGLLVFVVVTLLAANVWGVVDARSTAASAAREAARAYVEARSGGEADTAARLAATVTLEAAGRDPGRAAISIEGAFERCAPVVVRVDYTVPVLALPFLDGGPGFVTVTESHRELVDPWRSGIPGEAACDA